MSAPDAARTTPQPLEELRVELERVLGRFLGAPRRIASLERRPSAYRTSFAVEEVDVNLGDGTTLRLFVKDVSRRALSEHGRRAKPAFLADPRREIETYRSILMPSGLSTPTCYGAVIDPTADRYRLFLERAPGIELYQVGDRAVWERVARWLAVFHARFADEDARSTARSHVPLLSYDRGFYLRWPRRALAFAPRWPTDARRRIGWLADRYDPVVDRLVSLPTTVLHGEFYASNVLVHEAADAVRVCPIDWEMAAIGPGPVDLAALTAGSWSEAERLRFARAYHGALTSQGAPPTSFDDLLANLAYCRLHLAVQWLGWSADWTPPREHAHDWLGEAMRLAEELRL